MATDPVSSRPQIEALVTGRHRDPFGLLGPHLVDGRVVVRTLQPAAREVLVRVHLPSSVDVPMRKVHPLGLYEADVPGAASLEGLDYQLVVSFGGGVTVARRDPYQYGRVLSDYDLHLFGEGTHYRIYEKLGAHVVTMGVARGVHFARLGAVRAARQCRWRLQRLGRTRPRDAGSGAERRVGDLHSRSRSR